MNIPLVRFVGKKLARFLSQPTRRNVRTATCSLEKLSSTIRKGDVLLVEGSSRFSTAIKYLSQSTWSHAALYIGDAVDDPSTGSEMRAIAEADVNDGVRLKPLKFYEKFHTRICRPVGLSSEQIDTVVDYVVSRVGNQYDMKNIFDLARYLIQRPPVPDRWKRRLLSIGSGDPTRAICSSLIAQAYHSVKYPILPEFYLEPCHSPHHIGCIEEYAQIRHHSLFAPGDFDLSPYFDVVKPTVENGFDPSTIMWGEDATGAEEDALS